MNTLIVAVVIVSLLIVGGLVIATIDSDIEQSEEPEEDCSNTCGNSCTPTDNCGLGSCGAIKGSSCGCR